MSGLHHVVFSPVILKVGSVGGPPCPLICAITDDSDILTLTEKKIYGERKTRWSDDFFKSGRDSVCVKLDRTGRRMMPCIRWPRLHAFQGYPYCLSNKTISALDRVPKL